MIDFNLKWRLIFLLFVFSIDRSVSNGNRESSGSSDFASTSRTPHPRCMLFIFMFLVASTLISINVLNFFSTADSLTSGGRSSSASIEDESLPQKVLFRPIKSAPLTPPKQQTDGSIPS